MCCYVKGLLRDQGSTTTLLPAALNEQLCLCLRVTFANYKPPRPLPHSAAANGCGTEGRPEGREGQKRNATRKRNSKEQRYGKRDSSASSTHHSIILILTITTTRVRMTPGGSWQINIKHSPVIGHSW
ncbi:hypothetical protein EYF80_040248 [Liparis tanakae]|uniref:Uncharacterized protein n=1 Tax=Liparis tanakae TaxID=230148 RepID=A0A4Z2G8S2_9TELE|nr:hypothetical protein EYF80_040248 [Liparis tanakae]